MVKTKLIYETPGMKVYQVSARKCLASSGPLNEQGLSDWHDGDDNVKDNSDDWEW